VLKRLREGNLRLRPSEALIMRVKSLLQRVIGVFHQDLEADSRTEAKRP
jgi:hypothetical protein